MKQGSQNASLVRVLSVLIIVLLEDLGLPNQVAH